MKSEKYKFRIVFLIVAFVTGVATIVLAGMMVSFSGRPEYYAQEKNYGSVECKVTFDGERVTFTVADDSKAAYRKGFQLSSDNLKIAKTNGLHADLKNGDTVTVMSAPAAFSGFKPPIAAIKSGGKVYLDFDTGRSNIVENCEKARKTYYAVFLPTASVFAASTLIFAGLQIKKTRAEI